MESRYTTIVFDGFGTLIKIVESRSPYLKLMKYLKKSGRKPTFKDSNIIMSNNVDIEQLSILFDKEIPKYLLDEINDDLEFELNAIELYEDTITTLMSLKNKGFKIGLCSNLAKPYGTKIKTLFPEDLFDVMILSYEVESIKPEPRIYELLQKQLDCKANQIIFIGDHPILDFEIPKEIGMSARLIERNTQSLSDVLNDLL